MIITTNIESLKAMLPFIMSKEGTRYYLKGVCFQNKLLIATDGHKLACVKPVLFEGVADPEFILPDDVVLKITKTKPYSKHLPLLAQIDTEKKTVSAIHRHETTKEIIVLVSYPFEPIDGTFPDWRRVIPDVANYDKSQAASYNTENMAAFKSFGNSVKFFPNNDVMSPALVRGNTDHFDAVGVIMPMQSNKVEKSHPTWLNDAQRLSATPTKETEAA